MMPLSPPAPRRHLHTRRIECFGYQREDGMWDIEGHITDTKTYRFHNASRGWLEPGNPVHDMWIRITLDDRLIIHDIEAVTEAAPFTVCPDITSQFRQLIGLSIGRGWRRAVAERLGGPKGCTHLVELLGPIATVAFQTLGSGRDPDKRGDARERRDRPPTETKPHFVNGCHAWAEDGPLVAREFPQFYKGPKAKAAVTE